MELGESVLVRLAPGETFILPRGIKVQASTSRESRSVDACSAVIRLVEAGQGRWKPLTSGILPKGAQVRGLVGFVKGNFQPGRSTVRIEEVDMGARCFLTRVVSRVG